MNDDAIIERIMNVLQSENYEVLKNTDNSEVRGVNAVSVGIDSTEQVNFALPDYRHKLSIYVSSQITEDETGQMFENICKEVIEKLNKYVLKEAPLSDLFEDVPVVGFWFVDTQKMIVDDTYGKCFLAHLNYIVITSE